MSRYAFALLALAACTPETADVTAFDASRIEDGSAEAYAIVALLNDGATTLDTLDIEAELDIRAARSLIAHRDGGDRLFGTPDDDLYDDLAEVDAQYYVGDDALQRLARYATAMGYLPSDMDIVGTWEGVSFTLDEATAVLALANEASRVELDDDIGLNSRAVSGILAARPIADMNALSQASYVGPSALTALRDYVRANAEPEGAGVGETCATTDDCADSLVCMGEIAYGTGIFCVDESMYGNFTYDEAVAIPDGGTVTTSVDVQGLATVPVDVVLTLDIDHPRPADLVVTIDNFNGYGETVWSHEASPSTEIVIRAFPSDDMVNGQYNLHVTDTVTGEAGTLRGWNLYIVSNWD